ncbi:MAG: hypothetical protein K9H25_05750 [Rhodospirillum sp.]|nr:hypothetical protein [Rhodospirillum sp.]MCF8490251.1 hypothetical protein [Rhodospirillum sp.]MCF8501252.1 hypothetical protein [Rhodospirillum sp.]
MTHPFIQGMFLIHMFIGGCAGSTSGAIKIFRWQLMGRTLMGQFRQTLSPHRVVVTRYGSRNVTDDMLSSVRTFFFMYLMTWGLLSLALMLFDLDLLSATSAVAQAMANAGPGLGPLVGPGTTFAAVPDPAKWLLALAMLLGRLEFTAVFILLVPDFWIR